MNLLAVVSLCILGTSTCSKILGKVIKPSPKVIQNKLTRFKSIALYNEPLLRYAHDSSDKILCRALWEDASHHARKRVAFVFKFLQNCGCEEQEDWIERNIEDARYYGIEEEVIQRDLVPFFRQVSAFLESEGSDIIDELPKMKIELFKDYHANLFFHLNALWNRLDAEERKQFRANSNPYFLNKIIPDASAAYVLNSLPHHVPALQNPDISDIFWSSVHSSSYFLSQLYGRPPTHNEIESPLFIDLMEITMGNPELWNQMKLAIKYLLDVMRVTEDMMGVEANGLDTNDKPSNQTHRE